MLRVAIGFLLETEWNFGISFPSPPATRAARHGLATKDAEMTPLIRLTVVVPLVGLDAGGSIPV